MFNILTIYNFCKTNNDFNFIIKLLKLTLKQYELETLLSFCEILNSQHIKEQDIFENYYISYKLPHIEKEFDLLKIGEDTIINIELKSEYIEENKILLQLKRNHYYLSMLNKKIICCVYIKEGNLIYILENNKLVNYTVDLLISNLSEIKDYTEHLNALFSPLNFLISPFNNTSSFLNSKYYLTQQQEEIKNDLLKKIASNKIFSIEGVAGTGKTLLIYDIAKNLQNNCIVHCAQANDGIQKLKENKWNIITIKEFNQKFIEDCDVIIVDESQRISLSQVDKFISTGKIIIFSHDENQKLNSYNDAKETVKKIKDISNIQYKLSKKIRHNEELAAFIYQMFDLNKVNKYKNKNYNYNNTTIHYEKNLDSAKNYIHYLKNTKNYNHIYLTNSVRRKETLDDIVFDSNISAHKSIGQEYDNVLVVIDQHFYYNNNKLAYKINTYYNPIETLFQAMSRVRKKLFILIINNEEVFMNCMKIMNN
ncbi:DUF2075 domain-containing protein, partial [Campylobacter coli]|nr:DUF2075 domain-containing protein [Campylobacter coli]